MKRIKLRTGFTIVELLVAIAIVGVLAGLLLPAVQAAREAARRMRCGNNLKQLALACHMYHDVHETLPPAWLAKPGYGYLQQSHYYSLWGWGAIVLPYMEQETLHDRLRVGEMHLQQAAADARMLLTMQQPISVHRCPSDDGPVTNTNRNFFPFGVANQALATSNYVASNSAYDVNAYPNGVRQGAFIEDCGRNWRDISDGSISTFLLGERRWSVRRTSGEMNTVGATVVYGIGCRNYPGTRADVAACGRPRLNCSGIDEPVGNNWARRGFSSNHPGGANFAMCDGGVRFVSEMIDHDSTGNAYQRSGNYDVNTVYECLIAIQDHNPVGDF